MRYRINPKSDKKKLRDKINALQFDILKIERGEKDELTGRPANGLGRFHILPVGEHPRLEFCPLNILLVNWMPYHFWWHHYGRKSKKNDWTENRIKEIKGVDYEERLLIIEKSMPIMSMFYLECLYHSFKSELMALKGIV